MPAATGPLALAALLLAGCQWLVSLDGLTGGDAGPTCQADLTRDPSHCGACGHTCLGGECQMSRCLPSTIAMGQGSPLGIDVSANYVVWVNQSPAGLVRFRKTDGDSRPLSSPSDVVDGPFDVAIDANEEFVYWSELANARIYRKLLIGGPKETFGLGGPGQAAFLAIDGPAVYVSDHQATVGYIATDKVLYREDYTIGGLAAKSGLLYWARQTANQIVAGPAAGGTSAVVIIDGLAGEPMGVAVDNTNVYWIEGGSRVMQAPKEGGAATPVTLYESRVPFGQSDIAVDDRAIYWTEGGVDGAAGRVRRLAR